MRLLKVVGVSFLMPIWIVLVLIGITMESLCSLVTDSADELDEFINCVLLDKK